MLSICVCLHQHVSQFLFHLVTLPCIKEACNNLTLVLQDPGVQSIVSGQNVNCLISTIPNSRVFLLKKCE